MIITFLFSSDSKIAIHGPISKSEMGHSVPTSCTIWKGVHHEKSYLSKSFLLFYKKNDDVLVTINFNPSSIHLILSLLF